MSYDIKLVDAKTGKTLELDHKHNMIGGTYQVGGTKELYLNITYNYSHSFCKYIGEKGIRTIYGMTGDESLFILYSAIRSMNSDISENYWKNTEGNAKMALLDLFKMAALRPDGIWEGD